MNEETFKTVFITNFISTWCANNYDDACSRGKHEILENPPIEDAIYLADKAWEKYRNT